MAKRLPALIILNLLGNEICRKPALCQYSECRMLNEKVDNDLIH